LQLSLLHGFAFAVFYTFLGIPLGRIADRGNRRNLVIGGTLVWSVMTSLCGIARSFGLMFIARVGVGVGEAALTPAAYSMLGDYFPPGKLARVLSVYTAAIYVGAGIATMSVGALLKSLPAVYLPLIGHLAPWRMVFVLVGLMGIPCALLTLSVREPARKDVSTRYGVAGASLAAVFAQIWQRRGAYGTVAFGLAAIAMMTNGIKGWVPTYFIRTFGWTIAQTGFWFGSGLLVFGTAGVILGGVLAGWLRARRHQTANLQVALLTAALMMVFGIAAPLTSNAALSLALYCATLFSGALPFGAAAAAIQEITPNQMRGQVAAIYLFIINLAGIGLGPTVVAFFTDVVFRNDHAIRYSLALLVGLGVPLALVVLGLGLRSYRKALAEKDF
jgi:MFS family permease